MKKIVITAPREVKIEEVPIPSPGPGELLVKAELSGVSAGTEMLLYRGTYPNFELKKWAQWREYPVLPGYELVGTVMAVGEEVGADSGAGTQIESLGPASASIKTSVSEFKVGDRVICFGEHAQYVCCPAVLCAKLPDSLSSEEGTLAVLATTAQHCIRRADIKYGDTVAVMGMGMLGLLTMQHAKNAGARKVIALDLVDERLEAAKKAGADVVINPSKCDAPEAIRQINDGILADVVVEVTGVSGTADSAIELLRDRGRLVLLGWHTDGVRFGFSDFYFRELTVIASQAVGPEAGLPYSYVRWCSDQSLKWSVDLLAKGALKMSFTPTRFHYSDIKKVYDMIDKRDPAAGIQTILTWD